MRCPYLKEARVKYCEASAFRKMIPEAARDAGGERCSSERYLECDAAVGRGVTGPAGNSCPFLRDADAEYCGATPMTRYIPTNDAILSRCTSDGYPYCELHRAASAPGGGRMPDRTGVATPAGSRSPVVVVDGMPVPTHLSYAPNHMWLDVREGGRCRIGVDAFWTRVFDSVDGVGFVNPAKGADHAAAILTVGGVELTMVFAQPLENLVPNDPLRASPSNLVSDPYGAGWLFEGDEPALRGAPVGAVARAGLIGGESAARWIAAEASRLSELAHEMVARPAADGTRLVADGGTFEAREGARLDRGAVIELFGEFFSSRFTWRQSW